MGDLETSNYGTGTHVGRKIVMIDMRILGLLIQYQNEEVLNFVEQLQHQATLAEYRDFFILSLENDSSDKGNHPILKAGNVEEWATVIHEDLKKQASKFPILNITEEDGNSRNIMREVLIKNDADNGRRTFY